MSLLPLYVLLVLAATVVEPPAARSLAFAGLALFALGVAAYAVSPGSDEVHTIAEAAAASGDPFFVANTGLLLLGLVSGGLAAVLAIHRGPPVSPGRALALLGISAFGLWTLVPLTARSGGWRPALAAAGIGALAFAAAGAARLLGAVQRNLRDSPVQWPGAGNGSLARAAAFALGALAVVAGWHVSLVFLGLGVAVGSDFLDRRVRGAMRIPWLAIVLLVLVPVWWLMNTVAGPIGLTLAALRDVPFSPAAERLIALALGLIAWALLGLWPVHRLFPGGLLAPLGIALWLRIASPAAAGRLEHWRPLFVPLGVLGLWGAALTGRAASACNALAFVALASEAPGSVPAALILGASALALGVGPARSPRSATERLAWMLAALAFPFAFEAGFRAQVIYTLLAAAGAALACWTSVGRVPDSAAA